MSRYFLSIAVALITSLFFGSVAFGYVSSSTNYRIQEDSVNAGGLLSTSTNYRIEDTIGESAIGTSSSATFALKAGYQKMQETYLALTLPGNITLSPNLPTNGGGVANGQGTWTVITDNVAGYTLALRASSSPALSSGANNFANYVPALADPDFTFTTPAAASRFGFSPEGNDIVSRFKDNGAVCNLGASDAVNSCWDALSTSAQTIALRTTGNHPLGTSLTIKFRAASGASNVQPAGNYTATATVTLLAR